MAKKEQYYPEHQRVSQSGSDSKNGGLPLPTDESEEVTGILTAELQQLIEEWVTHHQQATKDERWAVSLNDLQRLVLHNEKNYLLYLVRILKLKTITRKQLLNPEKVDEDNFLFIYTDVAELVFKFIHQKELLHTTQLRVDLMETQVEETRIAPDSGLEKFWPLVEVNFEHALNLIKDTVRSLEADDADQAWEQHRSTTIKIPPEVEIKLADLKGDFWVLKDLLIRLYLQLRLRQPGPETRIVDLGYWRDPGEKSAALFISLVDTVARSGFSTEHSFFFHVTHGQNPGMKVDVDGQTWQREVGYLETHLQRKIMVGLDRLSFLVQLAAKVPEFSVKRLVFKTEAKKKRVTRQRKHIHLSPGKAKK